DLAGVAGDAELARSLEEAAADNLKRVRRAPAGEPDWTAEPGLDAMTDFLEIKTVWHPLGI
ncbi:MAG: aldehyde dehydrogenase, partial [Nocardioides sp.]